MTDLSVFQQSLNATNNALLVRAQSPVEGEEPRVLISSQEMLKNLAKGGWTNKIGQYMALVRASELVPGHPSESIPGLLSPTTIFRGVERPWTNNVRGEKIYVYVTNPPYSFSFDGRQKFDKPRTEPKPLHSVFITLVEYDLDTVARFSRALGNANLRIDGAILDWEWVLADARDPSLPEDYDNRFTLRVR